MVLFHVDVNTSLRLDVFAYRNQNRSNSNHKILVICLVFCSQAEVIRFCQVIKTILEFVGMFLLVNGIYY